ncbi:hypothetical protein SBBP2_1800002 [Burkholderiales bacterium]|nr:hypothetical protein SBBP2_1800002 [Burkholderiales bacterium]
MQVRPIVQTRCARCLNYPQQLLYCPSYESYRIFKGPIQGCVDWERLLTVVAKDRTGSVSLKQVD